MSYSTGALPEQKVNDLIAKMRQRPLVASVEDDRDIPYVWSGKPVGSEATMEPWITRKEDQGQFGTCTANASSSGCELKMNMAGAFTPLVDELARMFGYWWAGVLDNLIGDVGRTPRNALKAIFKYGLCRESLMPYTAANIDTPPSAAALADGATRKLQRYTRVALNPDSPFYSIQEIKRALNDGHPVTIAFRCYRWRFGIHGARGTHYNQPGAIGGDQLDYVGNHETVLIGFKDTNDGTGGYFISQESWSESYADAGIYCIPYILLTNDLIEAWAIENFAGFGAPVPETPLTPAQVDADRILLENMQLGARTASGWAWDAGLSGASLRLALFAAYECLRRRGRTASQIAQVTGLPLADVLAFINNPDHQPRIAGWQTAFA